MKSILVKYVGPTNRRSSRVIATDGDFRVAMSYDGPESVRAVAVKRGEPMAIPVTS